MRVMDQDKRLYKWRMASLELHGGYEIHVSDTKESKASYAQFKESSGGRPACVMAWLQ